MNTTLLINYIDQLRKDRNIMQEPFIDGIVSQRQYSRYKKGINDVPFDVINKLSDKLSIPLSQVISTFELSVHTEINDVITFFNHVIRNRISQAKQLDAYLRDRHFIKPDIKLYYKISKLLLTYYEQSIDVETLLTSLKREMKYPGILNNATLSEYEIYALGLIMQYDKAEIPTILNTLLKLDRLKRFVDVKNPYATLLNQFFIIKNLGRLKRYEDVITYSDETIKFCQEYFLHYTLHNFYYYKALAHFYLNQQDLFEGALRNTVLEVLRKPKEAQDRFFTMIEKDTSVNPKTFIKENLFK